MTQKNQTQMKTSRKKARPSKSVKVQRMLKRKLGATLPEIMKATQWQAHSSRAMLSGLRKRGFVILKECRPDGETCYRVEA